MLHTTREHSVALSKEEKEPTRVINYQRGVKTGSFECFAPLSQKWVRGFFWFSTSDYWVEEKTIIPFWRL